MPKASSKNNQKKTGIPIISVLLEETQYDFNLFVSHFQKKWHLRFAPHREENAMGMIVDGMIIGCALIVSPVSDPGISQSAANNIVWPKAPSAVSAHKAHVKVTLTREKDPVAANILLTKVVCSLIQQQGVLGVYLNPGLVEPAYYADCAEEVLEENLPTSLWVHINTINEKNSCTLYSSGMVKFGKREFEIIKTKKNFMNAHFFLRELIKYTLENDVNFKDADTVGPDDVKIPLSLSNGIKVKGTTIKIHI